MGMNDFRLLFDVDLIHSAQRKKPTRLSEQPSSQEMGKAKARKVEPKKGEKAGKSGVKKIWGTKQVLSSKFSVQMPSPQPGSLEGVMNALKIAFPTSPLRRISRPNKKSTKYQEPSKPEEKSKKPPGFVLGINQVTKGLERDELSIIVAARDVLQVLVEHLPVLCFLKNTRMVPVSGTGSELAHILGTHTCLAFGIQKSAQSDKSMQVVQTLHDEIVQFAVNLDYPWLAASRGAGPVPACPKPEMKPHTSIKKAEQEETGSRKRKRKRGSS